MGGPDFPPLTQQPIEGVDGTPDAEYPLRVLRAYRQRCNCHWDVSGLTEEATAVYNELNKHCVQRAKLLDDAIVVLERERNA